MKSLDRHIALLQHDSWEIHEKLQEKNEEIERLKEENELLKSNPNFVYAMRNNKAIDIIKNYLCSYDYTSTEFKEIAEVFMNLLNTLKGVDK